MVSDCVLTDLGITIHRVRSRFPRYLTAFKTLLRSTPDKVIIEADLSNIWPRFRASEKVICFFLRYSPMDFVSETVTGWHCFRSWSGHDGYIILHNTKLRNNRTTKDKMQQRWDDQVCTAHAKHDVLLAGGVLIDCNLSITGTLLLVGVPSDRLLQPKGEPRCVHGLRAGHERVGLLTRSGFQLTSPIGNYPSPVASCAKHEHVYTLSPLRQEGDGVSCYPSIPSVSSEEIKTVDQCHLRSRKIQRPSLTS